MEQKHRENTCDLGCAVQTALGRECPQAAGRHRPYPGTSVKRINFSAFKAEAIFEAQVSAFML